MAIERWRPVRGWAGYYEVSDYGRVRFTDWCSQRSSALARTAWRAVTTTGTRETTGSTTFGGTPMRRTTATR